MDEILAQFFGILVTIGCIVTNQLSKRWQILLGQAFINIFSVFNQLFIGASFTVPLLCSVAVIHCLINSFKSKKCLPIKKWENIVFCVAYLVTWSIGFVFSQKSGTPIYFDIMSLLATLCFIGITLLPKERDIRICTLSNMLIYFIYDLINLNVAALGKLFGVISTVIAMIRYREKKTK